MDDWRYHAISISCPACGKGNGKTVGWLQVNPTFACIACGKDITVVDTDGYPGNGPRIRSEAEAAIDAFRDAIDRGKKR